MICGVCAAEHHGWRRWSNTWAAHRWEKHPTSFGPPGLRDTLVMPGSRIVTQSTLALAGQSALTTYGEEAAVGGGQGANPVIQPPDFKVENAPIPKKIESPGAEQRRLAIHQRQAVVFGTALSSIVSHQLEQQKEERERRNAL